MKNYVRLSVLVVCTVCAGCGGGVREQAAEARVAQRMAELEEQMGKMQADFAGVTNALARTDAAIEREGKVMVAEVRKQLEKFSGEVQVICQAAVAEEVAKRVPARGAGAAVAPLARPAPVQGSKAGVPSAVYDQIAADAARAHPGDYRTQEYLIKEQVEAYLKLKR